MVAEGVPGLTPSIPACCRAVAKRLREALISPSRFEWNRVESWGQFELIVTLSETSEDRHNCTVERDESVGAVLGNRQVNVASFQVNLFSGRGELLGLSHGGMQGNI